MTPASPIQSANGDTTAHADGRMNQTARETPPTVADNNAGTIGCALSYTKLVHMGPAVD